MYDSSVLSTVCFLAATVIGVCNLYFYCTRRPHNKQKKLKTFCESTGELRAPQLPDYETHKTKVAKVHVKNGQAVDTGELLIELETSKVVLEIVSPKPARIESIEVEEGQPITHHQYCLN